MGKTNMLKHISKIIHSFPIETNDKLNFKLCYYSIFKTYLNGKYLKLIHITNICLLQFSFSGYGKLEIIIAILNQWYTM